MKYGRIKILKKNDGLLVNVALARPEVRNAFDAQTIRELTTVFSAVGRETEFEKTAVVLLTGEGKSFCAGADLEYMKSVAKFGEKENREDAELLFAMFQAISTCKVPVISRVHGHVMGGGLGLVACSDIAFADEDTAFRFSEVRLGILPAVISPFVLAKVSPLWARRWMLTGETFLAEHARHAGLLHFVGNKMDVDSQCDRAIKAVLEAAPGAVAKTKVLLGKIDRRQPLEVKDIVIAAIAEARSSAEGQEGLGSFLEKREPTWRQ